jgi:DNA-binding transcriptional regulator YiaG
LKGWIAMKPELKDRLARLEPTQVIAPVSSGSPVDLVLRRLDPKVIWSISAIQALIRRHVKLLKAKRTIETVMSHGEAVIRVPMVEDCRALAADLRKAGVIAIRLAAMPIDVRVVRQSLGLTQEQFALRFGLDMDAVQNWEQGRNTPDRTSLAYLRTIAQHPEAAAKSQEQELA